MTPLALFHGTTMPPRRWATGVTGDVVLQPFHPVVHSGAFADWFPLARRWVYTNPTAVDRLRQADVPDDLLVREPADRWRLPRLRMPEGFHVALDDAAALAALPGVDGLFVDDLDWMILHHEDTVGQYLAGLATRTRCPIFVNRGFPVLTAVPRVEAVLAEGMDNDLANPDSHAWIETVALPALSWAHRAGHRVHRLEYLPAVPVRHPSTATRLLDRSLASLCTSSHLVNDEQLDLWREWA